MSPYGLEHSGLISLDKQTQHNSVIKPDVLKVVDYEQLCAGQEVGKSQSMQ